MKLLNKKLEMLVICDAMPLMWWHCLEIAYCFGSGHLWRWALVSRRVDNSDVGPAVLNNSLMTYWATVTIYLHDDVMKWKHFPRYWPIVRGIHRSPVNSPHKDQWRGALMFCLICAWINRDVWFETPLRSLWRHCYDIFWFEETWQHVASH